MKKFFSLLLAILLIAMPFNVYAKSEYAFKKITIIV